MKLRLFLSGLEAIILFTLFAFRVSSNVHSSSALPANFFKGVEPGSTLFPLKGTTARVFLDSFFLTEHDILFEFNLSIYTIKNRWTILHGNLR